MSADTCKNCGAARSQTERALHRKLVNRGAEEFLCKKCLSAHFDIPEAKLDELAQYYRDQGCMLFI